MAGIAWTLHPALFYEKYGCALVQLWDSGTLRNLFVPIRRLSATIGAAVTTGVGARSRSASDKGRDERTSSELHLSPDTPPTEDGASSRANLDLLESSVEPSTSQCNELAFQGDMYTIARRERKQTERLKKMRENLNKPDTTKAGKPRKKGSIMASAAKKKEAYGRLKTIGTPVADLHGALPRRKSVTLEASDMSKLGIGMEEDDESPQESWSESMATESESLRHLKEQRGKKLPVGTPPTGRRTSRPDDISPEVDTVEDGSAATDAIAISDPLSRGPGTSISGARMKEKRTKDDARGTFPGVLQAQRIQTAGSDLFIPEVPQISEDSTSQRTKKGRGAKTPKYSKYPEEGEKVGSRDCSQPKMGGEVPKRKDDQGVRAAEFSEDGRTSVKPGPDATRRDSGQEVPHADLSERKRSNRRPKALNQVTGSAELLGTDTGLIGSPQVIKDTGFGIFKQKHSAGHGIPHSPGDAAIPTEPEVDVGRQELSPSIQAGETHKHKKKGRRGVKSPVPSKTGAPSEPEHSTSWSGVPESSLCKVNEADEYVPPPGPTDLKGSPPVVRGSNAPKRKKKGRKGVQKAASLEAGAASRDQGLVTDPDKGELALSLKSEGSKQPSKGAATSEGVPSPDVMNMLLEVLCPVFKKSSNGGEELSTGDQALLRGPHAQRGPRPSWAALDGDDHEVSPHQIPPSEDDDPLRKNLDTWDPSEEECYNLTGIHRMKLVKPRTIDSREWRGTSFSRDDLSLEDHPETKGPKEMSPQLLARKELLSEVTEWQSETTGAPLPISFAQKFPYQKEKQAQPSFSTLEALEVLPASSPHSSHFRGLEGNASARATAETALLAKELRSKWMRATLSGELPDKAREGPSRKFIASVHQERDHWIPPGGTEAPKLPSPPEGTKLSLVSKTSAPKATAERAADAGETRHANMSARKEKRHAKASKERTRKKEGRKRGPTDRRQGRVTNDDGVARSGGVLSSDISQPAQSPLDEINKRMETFESTDDLGPALEPVTFSSPDSVVMSSTGQVSVRIRLTTRKRHSMVWPFGGLLPK